AAERPSPAFDVLQRASRVMTAVAPAEHVKAATRLRGLLAAYEKQKDLILLGAYQKGSDRRVDEAIGAIDGIRGFLKQGTREPAPFAETVARLEKV
ncbi:MAG TPA: EscN/YscN/HrcN family type III secretion system ATPase, partial [Solibacterales bacterium]|nr:EscN/YscN/HrcN family type III secretion system ATPase [Bryobacterales bacterium]